MPVNLADQLSLLSKRQLIEVLRAHGQITGDTARTSKDDYAARILAMGDKIALDALDQFNPAAAALVAGAMPMAPVVPLTPVKSKSPAPVVEMPDTSDIKPVGKKTLGELFGVRGKHAKFEVTVWNDPASPERDPLYRFDATLLHLVASAIERGRAPWCGGPAGTGKTEFLKNFAACTGRSFHRVSLDSGIERYELIGGERVRGGDLIFQYGVVLRAFVRPGALCLLDEVSFGRPEYLSALHAALDSNMVTVPETGEVIKRAEGMVFAVADNTFGKGDPTGVYTNTREQNGAFCNRFARFIPFTYLDEAVERQIIMDRALALNGQKCPSDLAGIIVSFLNVCRKAAEASQLDAAPTMREAFYLAEALMDGVAPRLAFEVTMVNRASLDVQEPLQQLWKANVSEANIELALDGKPLTADQQPKAA